MINLIITNRRLYIKTVIDHYIKKKKEHTRLRFTLHVHALTMQVTILKILIMH